MKIAIINGPNPETLDPTAHFTGLAIARYDTSAGYYLFYSAPYILTLAIMILTSSPGRSLAGAPGELSITK